MDAIIISTDEECGELVDLADTLDMNIKEVFVQKGIRPHPRFFVGKGKIEEISDYVESVDLDVVLVNGVVKPSQHYNIERKLGIECIDRIGLILRIFKTRAGSPESKLQIEHAMLKYEVPLLREWIHRSKGGEHPGFLAGGEYKVDVYYDFIRKRISKIGKELEKIRKDRNIQRKFRKKMGCATLALVGYTNAGKTSLFNSLTKSDLFVDDKLFSTLSTTSRKMSKHSRTIIVTDVIGFIADMPPWMIESFKASLEETRNADCLLWVFDGLDNEADLLRKHQTCKETLDLSKTPKIIPVLSKEDLVDEGELEKRKKTVKRLMGDAPSIISSKSLFGIDDLESRIIKTMRMPIRVRISLNSKEKTHSALSWMFNTLEIINIDYGTKTVIDAWCEKSDPEIIKSRFKNVVIKVDILE